MKQRQRKRSSQRTIDASLRIPGAEQNFARGKEGKMSRWLVVVDGDVEPRLEGPFKSDRLRVVAAREHRRNDREERNGLYRLDVSATGTPRISSFVSRELSPNAAAT